MTFALFVGAGNIFPPKWSVILQAGEHRPDSRYWLFFVDYRRRATGLLLWRWRNGGGVDSLSTPIGKAAGLLLATVCYLAVGQLPTPRTGRRCRLMPVSPAGDSAMPLLISQRGLFRYR